MPEGPSIVILKEAVRAFKGQEVLAVGGNTKLPVAFLKGQRVKDFKSWGKHFLICFPKVTIRIHFLLFGTYSINEKKKEKLTRFYLKFPNGSLYFYASSIKQIDEKLSDVYDWSGDVMNKKWDPNAARVKLKAVPTMMVCDALLNQEIFAGVGNIIKNEVLFRIKLHPETMVGDLPPTVMTALIIEAKNYSFDFLKWKKAFVLKKHWLAHTKKICPRCNIPFEKKHLGKTNRRSFYCNNCQVKYSGKKTWAAKK